MSQLCIVACRCRYDFDKGTFRDTAEDLGELRFPMAELLACSPVLATERPLTQCTSGNITFELRFTPDAKK